MCFTPAFVVFLPLAPICAVWGSSLYYSRQYAKNLLAKRGVFVSSIHGTFPQVGGAILATMTGGIIWTAQRRVLSTLRQTSTAILSNHDLDIREVWQTVRPSNFQQPTARERLPAAAESVTTVLRRHFPSVARLTASGAVSLLLIGGLQPVGAAMLAGSEATRVPPQPENTSSSRGDYSAILQNSFKREIAASKAEQERRRHLRQQKD